MEPSSRNHLQAPTRYFWERASHLGEDWASPGVDPNAEFWRCLTVMSLAYRAGLADHEISGYLRLVGNRSILQEHTNQDQTTRPAPVDIDIELRASMHRSRDSLLRSLAQTLDI